MCECEMSLEVTHAAMATLILCQNYMIYDMAIYDNKYQWQMVYSSYILLMLVLWFCRCWYTTVTGAVTWKWADDERQVCLGEEDRQMGVDHTSLKSWLTNLCEMFQVTVHALLHSLCATSATGWLSFVACVPCMYILTFPLPTWTQHNHFRWSICQIVTQFIS